MSTVADRRRAVMYMRLQSAFRTAIACTIVGCTTLYGPSSLKKHITFPAFAYVTAILIVSDGNLGDAIRGCWHALCATLQVVPLTMLSIWVIGCLTSGFSPAVGAMAVAVLSFLVALPKCTHLMCKRIAFGQLVIVYVDSVIHCQHYSADTHPLHHVAASTGLGALSALLALLLPYPRLAHREVRKHSQLYAENASERMNLYLNALNADKSSLAAALINQAQPLNEAGNKLLQTIMLTKDGLLWEKPWMRFSRTQFVSPGDKLQGIETQLRGMEIALKSITLSSDGWDNQQLKDVIFSASTHISLKLQQATCFLPSISMVEREFVDNLKLPHKDILSVINDPSATLFLCCAHQILSDSTSAKFPDTDLEKQVWTQWFSERFLFALKCLLSLGLAMIAGLTFSKENGYWSGLTIAISFLEGRQALFTISNARAQGTAIGSVYGLLGCFLFQMLPEIRFLALLPWIFFACFLRHSRMYGQAGGSSAIIGALLILGRTNYGVEYEFAIYRLTEAIIGLCCYILVELLLQPNRASTLVKKHMYLSLVTLEECLQQLSLLSCGHFDKLLAYRQKETHLRSLVHDLDNFIKEAELEPNFSLLPFQGSNYKKVHNSLSNMVDVLRCLRYILDKNEPWKEIQELIDIDLDKCKETINKCLQNIDQKPQEKGKYWSIDIEQPIISASCLLQESTKVEERLKDMVEGEEDKEKMLVSLSIWRFCTSYLITETITTERLIKELVHWE